MLHHVSVGVRDVGRAAQFYDAALGALGYKRVVEYLPYALGYGTTGPVFWVGLPHDQQAPTVGNGTHIGFSARTKDAVHKFYDAALANGGSDNGPPGPREMYGPQYYGAFVIDLDGNRLEATLHQETAPAKAAAAKSKRKAKTAKSSTRKASRKGSRKSAKRKARRR
jgi:catechol 2,3-dioxygenase-like lactoylglutathione lyase family enzyme